VILAVIFDLDGVLRRWPPARIRSIERRHRIPAGSIDRVAFAPALLARAVTGSLTDDAWREEVARELELLHGARGRHAVNDWSRLSGEVDPAMLELVRDVRQLATVALLTNATTRLVDDLTTLGIAGDFDAIVSSADLHRSKPDPEVFRWTAQRLGVACADCAFVDDEPRNVAAAAAVGMAAIRHRDAAATRRQLARAGDWADPGTGRGWDAGPHEH
jgi:putative hydrolase of the HAD superfamily